MMFYLWLCLIKMTSPQETSKANNLQGMKNLMLPEVSSLQRGRGGWEAWGEEARESRQKTPVTCISMSRMQPTSFGGTSFPGN